MNPSPLLDWRGQTAVIAASGPSLSDAQVSAVYADDHLRVITTNTTWEKFPYAVDVIYACDMLWWKVNQAKIRQYNLIPRCWTQDRNSAERWGLNWVRQSARPGLGLKDLHVNGNSCFGAINLAYLFGCRRIILLGADMKPGPKGRLHWHEDHPAPCVQKLQFKEWLHKSVQLAKDLKAAGVDVINSTPDSALTVFRKLPIEEALRADS